MNPPNIAALVEAKDGTGLVEGDMLRQANDIPVEGAANIIKLRPRSASAMCKNKCFCTYVGEDECLGWVEANGDDVLGIAVAVPLDLLDRPLLREQVPGDVSEPVSEPARMPNLLLIVRHHDDELPTCQHREAGTRSFAKPTYRHIECILKPCQSSVSPYPGNK